MQAYSDEDREDDPHALPDLEIFQLSATEIAETMEDEIFEYMHKHEFRLAAMNSKVREQMFAAIVKDHGIEGGWFYQYCLPGCLPDSEPYGPFATANEAKQAARDGRAD